MRRGVTGISIPASVGTSGIVKLGAVGVTIPGRAGRAGTVTFSVAGAEKSKFVCGATRVNSGTFPMDTRSILCNVGSAGADTRSIRSPEGSIGAGGAIYAFTSADTGDNAPFIGGILCKIAASTAMRSRKLVAVPKASCA